MFLLLEFGLKSIGQVFEKKKNGYEAGKRQDKLETVCELNSISPSLLL